MGGNSFEAKSQSIEHHIRASAKIFEHITLTLLVFSEEDESAWKKCFFG